MQLLAAAAAGLLAGGVHVLAGPDHLAAVAPLGAGSRARAWRVGVLWGVGHAAGASLLGAAAVWARGRVEPAWISDVGERLVGLALIAVGLWGIAAAVARRTAPEPHRHGDRVHAHPHLRGGGGRLHTHASLGVGALHGVAGGAHLLAVLPALALPGRLAGVAYLAGFAVGTIAAMAAFAAAVGRLARGRVRRPAYLGACSVAALVVGAVWLLR